MLTEIQKEVIKAARDKVLASFSVYNVPGPYQDVILEAFNRGLDGQWDIFNMDGCTLAADYWPTKWAPSCTPHDFHFITGRGGWLSNRIFTEINKCYAMPPSQVKARHFAVTAGWWLWYKWKHLKAGNVNKITPAMGAALEFYKKSGKLQSYRN